KIRSLTTQSNGSGEGGTTVQTEAISTRDAEYVRWVSIETDQKNQKGEELNFDELINIWGKSPAAPTGQLGQLQMALLSGVVPTGNFSAPDRQSLMQIVREENVYSFDQAKVERKVENGR